MSFPAIKWLNALRKMVANHIRLPNSGKSGVPGHQHPMFPLHNTPLELCRRRCTEAGLVQKGGAKRKGETTVTTFRGDGPMSAYRFCDLKEEVKRWGVGSALPILSKKRPGKQAAERQGDQLVLAIPPITVVHHDSPWGDWIEVDFYLGIYNSNDRFTLPSTANNLYKSSVAATEEILKKMALKVLGEMLVSLMPLSKKFKRLLGPEYASDAGELTEAEEEEVDGEAEGEEAEGEAVVVDRLGGRVRAGREGGRRCGQVWCGAGDGVGGASGARSRSPRRRGVWAAQHAARCNGSRR